MNRTDQRRRWTAAKLIVALVGALTVSITAVPASSAAPTQAPLAACSTPLSGDGGLSPALAWIRCELEANGNGFPGFTPGAVDGGSTLDAVMALSLNGFADDPITVASLATVEAEVGGYISDEGWGTGDERYAGPLAKALLAVQLQGGDPHDFGGFDLEAELRARIQVTGSDAGRFSDLSAWGDYSNGFGQALAVLALSHTEQGIPTAAIDFLVDQQCEGGGFRGDYSVTGGCSDDAHSDTDYSAFALQALLAAPEAMPLDPVRSAVATWLLGQQDESGAFFGTGVTPDANANTAGLSAQALRAFGETEAADAAAAWLTSVQLTTANAAGTPAEGDLGAIGFVSTAVDDALVNGITEAGRDQWRRSIGQSVLGFASGPYGAAPGQAPFEPFASWEELVTQQYRDFAGRSPNAFELGVWVAFAEAGLRSPADVILGLSAPKVDSVDGKVLRLYNGLLNRPPTPIMQVRWAQQLNGGRTLASAATEFLAAADSPYQGLSDDAFIDELYSRFQHSTPPPAAATWKLRLAQGSWSRGAAAAWFAESTPAKTLSAVDIQVFNIMKAMNGSTPAAAYNADRASVHAGTVTVTDYALAILASDAYATRVG